jgi:hypothetical protein
MKSAPSLVLIACLTGSTMPLAAQDRIEAMPRPIARAVTDQAGRLAALQGGTRRDIRASTLRPEEATATQGSMHHRGNVSGRRRLVGALIGAGSGIAVGYAVGSRCGPGAPHAECVGYGQLTAGVLGGLGALFGAAIAAATAP